MNDTFHIMIVEDEEVAGQAILDNLEEEGYTVSLFKTAEDALAFFDETPVDLALLDYKLPGMSGEECFKKIKELDPLVPVIFMTAYSSVDKAVRLLKLGAYTYLTKPIDVDQLLQEIRHALDKVTLVKENRLLKENLRQRYTSGSYVFNSPAMQQVLNMVMRTADSAANILITGESGTGKEVIANIFHHYSRRQHNPFVKVNLAALPGGLIEAELFGAEKGAYTGCQQRRTGKFEEAHNGTLFLDEVGELPLETQVKLLRALQEREITRLGSNKPQKIDIRLITATNRNLEQMVKEKAFREDLYFRLNVIEIKLPPLRERKQDIRMLIDLFVKKFSQRENKSVESVSKEALHLLVRYSYPGNIRELENIIERAVILARRNIIEKDDLPVFLGSEAVDDYYSILDNASLTLPEKLTRLEKKLISIALETHNFNQRRAAKELGISESGLRYKLQSLKIQ